MPEKLTVIVFVIAEKGDYDPIEHRQGYLDGLKFMPNQVCLPFVVLIFLERVYSCA